MKCKTGLKKKAINCKKNVSIKALRFFITGVAGVGKSHLMKNIYVSHKNGESLFRIARQAQDPYSCSQWSGSH